MDDLNRLAQLIAAQEEGDLSDHGREVLAALALKHPDLYESFTRPAVPQ